MAAFIPGASPPLVRTPIRRIASPIAGRRVPRASLASRRAERAGEFLGGLAEGALEELFACHPTTTGAQEPREIEQVRGERLLRVVEAIDGDDRAVRHTHQGRLVRDRGGSA